MTEARREVSAGATAEALVQRRFGRFEPTSEVEAKIAADAAARRAQAEAKRGVAAFEFATNAGAPHAFEARAELVPSAVQAWVSTWSREAPPSGIALLAGPFGVGKSMAAQWAIAELWRRGRWDHDDDPGVWFALSSAQRLPCVEIQRAVYSDRIAALAAKVEVVGLLVIEDVRRYPESAWRLADEMHAILDRRHERGLATILTTNLLPDDFGDAYGSMWSRINGSTPGAVKLFRDDLRRGR